MENILFFVIGYVSLIVIWLVFSTVLFALSFVFRKNLSAIPVGITYIISFIIQLGIIIYSIYFLWQLISHGEWLFLVLALIFGGFLIGWWQFIYQLLLMPFLASAAYFLDKVDNTNFKDATLMGEVVDDKGHVANAVESDFSVSRRLAIWFSVAYFLNLFSLIINRGNYPTYKWGDFITTPFLWMISYTLFIGIFLVLYYKLRKGKFFYGGKKYFLASNLRVQSIILICLSVLYFALGVWHLQ